MAMDPLVFILLIILALLLLGLLVRKFHSGLKGNSVLFIGLSASGKKIILDIETIIKYRIVWYENNAILTGRYCKGNQSYPETDQIDDTHFLDQPYDAFFFLFSYF